MKTNTDNEAQDKTIANHTNKESQTQQKSKPNSDTQTKPTHTNNNK